MAYTREQKERGVRLNRYDTVCEGIGLDRVTENFRRGRIDGAVKVMDQEVVYMRRLMEKWEGMCIGSSTACNLVACCRVARRGERIVTIKCSLGERENERVGNREFVEGRGLKWEGAEEWFEREFGDKMSANSP